MEEQPTIQRFFGLSEILQMVAESNIVATLDLMDTISLLMMVIATIIYLAYAKNDFNKFIFESVISNFNLQV